jgi:hypothetical protein
MKTQPTNNTAMKHALEISELLAKIFEVISYFDDRKGPSTLAELARTCKACRILQAMCFGIR